MSARNKPPPGDPVEVVPYDPAWPELFERERARLLSRLEAALGPNVMVLEHVGATSVPGLPAAPWVDILAGLWAHPLEPVREPLLELGYEPEGDGGRDLWLDFRHPGGFRLRVVYATLGLERLVLRDFLRAHPEAAREHGRRKLELAARSADRAAYEAGKAGLLEAALEAASAWHVSRTGFAPVLELAAEMEGFGRPWMVGSGWAVDLELGQPSRVHEDLDLVVYREDQLVLQRHLMRRGWALATTSGCLRPWRGGARLELPWHQVQAVRGGAFLDVLFAEREGDSWRWRRNLEVGCPLEKAVRQSALGVSYLAPEIVLLFKSTGSLGVRGKDAGDFEALLPRLGPEARAWLRGAIATRDAAHPWLERLA